MRGKRSARDNASEPAPNLRRGRHWSSVPRCSTSSISISYHVKRGINLLSLFLAPELEALHFNRFLDFSARKVMRRRPVRPDDADRAPRFETIRQLDTRDIGAERPQFALRLGSEYVKLHSLASPLGEGVKAPAREPGLSLDGSGLFLRVATTNPSRIACLRASFLARRIASVLSRVVRADGFS